jgi:hypothetical protein
VPVFFQTINEVAHEEGQDDMAVLLDLPLLQDTTDQDVWKSWSVTYRDVFILDPRGELSGVYNLTDNDLSLPENLEAFEAMLSSARGDD